MIVTAWKVLDDEVKAFCSQVCAVGMMRYKTAVQEWRKRGAEQAAPRPQVMSKITGYESQMRQSAEMIITSQSLTNAYTLARGKHSLKVSPLTSNVLGMAQDQAQPNLSRILCQEVAAASNMNKVFENERIDALAAVENNNIACTWETQAPVCLLKPALALAVTDTFRSAIDLQKVKSDQANKRAFRVSMASLSDTNDIDDTNTMENIESGSILNPYQQETNQQALRNSMVSNEHVDMDDYEIMDLWNESAPAVSTDLQHHPMFGDRGYEKTMQDIHAMKAILDQQKVQLEQVRRRTFVPPSA